MSTASLRSFSRRPRRFAPLRGPAGELEPGVDRLVGIVFDVDGTLCEPQSYMFKEMRKQVGIPADRDILDYIHDLPQPEQDHAFAKIRAIERDAMHKQRPQPGLKTLMDYVDSRGLKKGICTRNFDLPVQHLLTTVLPGHTFDPILTRAFRPPKPSPAGICHIASAWTCPADDAATNLIMVGDSIDDMRAGRQAGAATVLLGNAENKALWTDDSTDLVIERLDELIDKLERGFVGGG